MQAARSGGVSQEPGILLLHPIALASLALLILNDHLLKAAFPGVVTGKLSDVAGLAFFPLLIVAGWELATLAVRRPRRAGPGSVALAASVTAVVFTLVKSLPVAADWFGWGLGAVQWVIGLPGGVLLGAGVAPVNPARVIADPTDLLALPAVLAVTWIALRPIARRTHSA